MLNIKFSYPNILYDQYKTINKNLLANNLQLKAFSKSIGMGFRSVTQIILWLVEIN